MSAACLQAGLLCVSASCIRPGTEISHGKASAQQTWMRFIQALRHRTMPCKFAVFF